MNILKHLYKIFISRWSAPQGYKKVLSISLPLILSMLSVTVMLFTDRVFLGQYSVEALAAATPGGLTAFMFTALFLGVVGYLNTFVAQYSGSKQFKFVGVSLWQGIYFSLFSSVILFIISFFGTKIFLFAGHDPLIQKYEAIYFQILLMGAGLSLLHDALGCFYSGRGKTTVIMIVNFIGVIVNIPLDYAMINGYWGFPELGIVGAAYATLIGHFLITVIFLILIFNKKNNNLFGVFSKWKFDKDIFLRLIKFGTPAGFHFFMDMFAFTFFLLMVGRLGNVELAATNIAFSINMLAIIPMVGFSIATATLVGQSIGEERPNDAVKSTTNIFHLVFLYMIVIIVVFVFLPNPIIELFKTTNGNTAQFQIVKETTVVLLKFIAVYALFDALGLVFSAVLKGAGDSGFVGKSVSFFSVFVLAIPLYVSIEYFKINLYQAWFFILLYIILLSVSFMIRYKMGKWKSMSVIKF